MIGSGSRNYDIAIEGAVSRIATSDTQGEVLSGDNLVLTIQPDGLLTPGMYAKGEIVFQDDYSVGAEDQGYTNCRVFSNGRWDIRMDFSTF